jgi:hypothetical protein
MSEAKPTLTRAEIKAKRVRAVRILGMIASGLMVATVLVIFMLILRSERAHNDEDCKFAKTEQRVLGGTVVVEERRSCMPELEERRYLVRRAGKPEFELARKRLPIDRFAKDRYVWSLREDKAQLLVLRIDVDGKLASESFEEDRPR